MAFGRGTNERAGIDLMGQDAGIAPFGDACLERCICGLYGQIKRQIGGGWQFLGRRGQRSEKCGGEDEFADQFGFLSYSVDEV